MASMKKMEETFDQDGLKARQANHEAYKGGRNSKEIAKYYDLWAENGDYDLHLNQDRYRGPECVARALAEHYSPSERSKARILDVAAGTGRLGAELQKLGFLNIDALDPSEVMLRKAKDQNIYTNLFQEFLSQDNPVPVDDNSYDGLCVSGGFGEDHLPVSALHEMVRVVRPGGVLCFAMREDCVDVTDYKGTLEPVMKEIEAAGKWKMISKDVFAEYVFDKPGVLYQFIIL